MPLTYPVAMLDLRRLHSGWMEGSLELKTLPIIVPQRFDRCDGFPHNSEPSHPWYGLTGASSMPSLSRVAMLLLVVAPLAFLLFDHLSMQTK